MDKFKDIMGFLSSFIQVSAFLWAIWISLYNYLNGIEFSVPVWILPLTIIVSFISGYFISAKLGYKFKFFKTQTITFDYAPDPPTKHKWFVACDNKDDTNSPRYFSIKDGNYGNTLQILCTAIWYMDYLICGKYRIVEFIVDLKTKPVLYVRIQMKSKNNEETDWWWWQLGDPGSDITNTQWGKEIIVPPVYHAKSGNWYGVEINIPDIMKRKYAKEGWIFDKILCLRVRNATQIACINLYH